MTIVTVETIQIVTLYVRRVFIMNMEVIKLDKDSGFYFSFVLADEHGRVQALWSTFFE